MIKSILTKILSEYQQVYEQVWKTKKFKNPLLHYINNDCKKHFEDFLKEKNIGLLVKPSTGNGRTTKIPWFAFFDTRISKKASEGTYVAYLFNKDTQVVYLCLAQSTTEAELSAKEKGYNKKHRATQAVQLLLENEKAHVLAVLQHEKFLIDNMADTGNKLYDSAIIMYTKYELSAMPSEEILERDLLELIEIYRHYYEDYYLKKREDNNTNEVTKVDNIIKEPKLEIVLPEKVSEVLSQIKDILKTNSFTTSRPLLSNLYLSLKSKPFVILAGISGTGKSKLARLFAKAIGAEFLLVPVRPDWSDSTDLFGYKDLNGKFQPGRLTTFIKKANGERNKPYILCLDEMNLARVEYYFSDVLSVIESREIKDGRISSDSFLPEDIFSSNDPARGAYGKIYFSENLYIIGTVNMDETTFPFSKKVLDRANTIELSEVDLSLGLEVMESQEKIEPLTLDNAFLKSEYFGIQKCYTENPEAVQRVVDLLTKANECLKLINAQVAYRVRDEISYYVAYAQKFQLMSMEESLDCCLMQKILPRIQGSSMAVKKTLIGLFNLCLKETQKKVDEQDYEAENEIEKIIQNTDNMYYPESAKKIAFMLRRYNEENGYTSYWL